MPHAIRAALPVRVALAMLATVLLAGVASRPAAAETIRFGAILPLTGPATVIGTQEKRGIELAVDDINAKGGVGGQKIELVFEDNQAKPDLSVLSFNKLVDLQGVPVVFTGYSGPTLALAPLATRKKVLLVNCGAQADKLATASPYLINTISSTADEVGVMSKYLVSQGKKKAVILWENDAAGIGGRDDFVEAFPKAGGEIVAQEPVQFGQTDFRPALLKLAASNPDVMYVVTTANQLNLAQQYKQLNLTFVVAGSSFMSDPPTIADPSSRGFIHTQVKISAPDELAARFKARYGDDMDFFAKQYYNGTTVVIAALAKVLADKKPASGENLRQAVFDIGKFQGLIPMEFKSNTAKTGIIINVMHDGKDELLTELAAD
jgi:branched-chain amino acid transport system substrate-binding protein